jgi:hypothetical protein
LRGRIVGDSLGTYQYQKGGVLLTVVVYLMEVDTAEDHWEEEDMRSRRWVATAEAARMLELHRAMPLVEEALALLGAGRSLGSGDRRLRQPPIFAVLLGNVLNRLLGS